MKHIFFWKFKISTWLYFWKTKVSKLLDKQEKVQNFCGPGLHIWFKSLKLIKNASIENLILSGNINIKGTVKVGGLVGYSCNSNIYNCSYQGNGILKLSGLISVGLLIGDITKGNISGCKIITESKICFSDVRSLIGIFAGIATQQAKLNQIDIIANGGMEINSDKNIEKIGGFLGCFAYNSTIYDISLTINNGITIKSDTKQRKTIIKNIGGLLGEAICSVEASNIVFNFYGAIETHISNGTNEALVDYIGALIGSVNDNTFINDVQMIFQGNVVGNTHVSDLFTDNSERNHCFVMVNNIGSNIRVIELPISA